MKRARIAVIVNSLNRLELLREALGALASWGAGNAEWGGMQVFVYDAGSTDGTLAWLRADDPVPGLPIRLIEGGNDADTSFAAGLNRAAAAALGEAPDTDYLLFYETDNQILAPQPLREAMACLEARDDLAACGFTVRYRSGNRAGVGMPFPKLSHFLLGKPLAHRLGLERIPYHWTDLGGARFSPVDVVFTSPLLVRPRAWTESGGLDAGAFPFSECDVDWAKRLRDLGWHMGVVATEDVVHDNADAISGWSRNRAIQFHRGRLRYHRRHQPLRTALACPHLPALRHLLEYAAVVCGTRDPDRRARLKEQTARLLRSVWRDYVEKP